jgi:hypothetical protein
MALLAVTLAAAAGAYAVGSRRAPTGATASPESTAAPKTTSAPKSTAAPQSTAATPVPGRMDETTFWRLVAETRAGAGNDTGRQTQLLEARLRQLPAQQIAGFERIRRSLDRRIYTWDVWGAAYVIEDGCSDDCFRDFRAYLISLGRDPYEAALTDPDALAPVVQDAEEGDWENADNVAPDAYESATGEDIPTDDSDLSGNPRGKPWDDKDQDALVQRYPALAAKFR